MKLCRITQLKVEDAIRNMGKAGRESHVATDIVKLIKRERLRWMHIKCNGA